MAKYTHCHNDDQNIQSIYEKINWMQRKYSLILFISLSKKVAPTLKQRAEEQKL